MKAFIKWSNMASRRNHIFKILLGLKFKFEGRAVKPKTGFKPVLKGFKRLVLTSLIRTARKLFESI